MKDDSALIQIIIYKNSQDHRTTIQIIRFKVYYYFYYMRTYNEKRKNNGRSKTKQFEQYNITIQVLTFLEFLTY